MQTCSNWKEKKTVKGLPHMQGKKFMRINSPTSKTKHRNIFVETPAEIRVNNDNRKIYYWQ